MARKKIVKKKVAAKKVLVKGRRQKKVVSTKTPITFPRVDGTDKTVEIDNDKIAAIIATIDTAKSTLTPDDIYRLTTANSVDPNDITGRPEIVVDVATVNIVLSGHADAILRVKAGKIMPSTTGALPLWTRHMPKHLVVRQKSSVLSPMSAVMPSNVPNPVTNIGANLSVAVGAMVGAQGSRAVPTTRKSLMKTRTAALAFQHAIVAVETETQKMIAGIQQFMALIKPGETATTMLRIGETETEKVS